MVALVDAIRGACARVAGRATNVRVLEDRIDSYAQDLPLRPSPTVASVGADPERTAAFWLSLNAISFGSGWFPTLREHAGLSGSRLIEAGVRTCGPWPADELAVIDRDEVASIFGQDPGHELMALYAQHLRALGEHVRDEWGGSFLALARCGRGSAVALADQLAQLTTWRDLSSYDGLTVPFFNRAQLAAADLHAAGLAPAEDLHNLTLFSGDLVPHVLRLDGVLAFDHGLVARIEAGAPLPHGSADEVEIRACAVHAVELLVRARGDTTAAAIDGTLSQRAQEARYTAVPPHRSRNAAY